VLVAGGLNSERSLRHGWKIVARTVFILYANAGHLCTSANVESKTRARAYQDAFQSEPSDSRLN